MRLQPSTSTKRESATPPIGYEGVTLEQTGKSAEEVNIRVRNHNGRRAAGATSVRWPSEFYPIPKLDATLLAAIIAFIR